MHTTPQPPFLGGGPYCYSNSLSMMLGSASPGTAVIETLTGGPFGYVLEEGDTPFFSPYGMEPDIGLDAAVRLLGFDCRRRAAADEREAESWLRDTRPDRPLLAGPMEMGLFAHQPGMNTAIGADHFVVVLAVESDHVVFHDPHGHPFVTLPIGTFLRAWRTESLSYGSSFTARTEFRSIRHVDTDTALRDSLPEAAAWLNGRTDIATLPGSIGGSRGLWETARLVAAGPPDDTTQHLAHFAIRVGARRLADAAECLDRIGLDDAATTTRRHAVLVGALQYPIVAGDDVAAANGLTRLAEHYEVWREAINAAVRTAGQVSTR